MPRSVDVQCVTRSATVRYRIQNQVIRSSVEVNSKSNSFKIEFRSEEKNNLAVHNFTRPFVSLTFGPYKKNKSTKMPITPPKVAADATAAAVKRMNYHKNKSFSHLTIARNN